MSTKSSYNFAADIIRILAIIGVVIIHTTNAVYTRVDFLGGMTWWITIVLDSLSRIAIPLFLLLSGYFILQKDESFTDSLKRIFIRLGIPLLFWLFFYNWYGGGFVDVRRINISFFRQLFLVDIYHLYYLVIVIGLYFAAPLIRSYFKMATSSAQTFFMNTLILIGIAEIALQFIFRNCSANFFTMWIPYTGLFVAGYLLGHKAQAFSKTKLFIGYGLGLVATLGFNYVNSYLILHHNKLFSPLGCLSHYTDHYLSINVIFMSICAFLLLLEWQYTGLVKNTLVVRLVRSLAQASFGIYLLHPVINRFLEVQFHLAVDFSTLPLNEIILLKFVIVFIASYLITLLISRIPVVKYIVGGK